MRQILFRAKRIENGEWYEGSLHLEYEGVTNTFQGAYLLGKYSPAYKNAVHGYIEVDPETVSEFTGMVDSTGQKIFEGDVCKFRDWDNGDMCYVGQIKFECCQYVITGGPNKECPSSFYFPLSRIQSENIKIIGNIYDTKKGEELL